VCVCADGARCRWRLGRQRQARTQKEGPWGSSERSRRRRRWWQGVWRRYTRGNVCVQYAVPTKRRPAGAVCPTANTRRAARRSSDGCLSAACSAARLHLLAHSAAACHTIPAHVMLLVSVLVAVSIHCCTRPIIVTNQSTSSISAIHKMREIQTSIINCAHLPCCYWPKLERSTLGERVQRLHNTYPKRTTHSTRPLARLKLAHTK
jgi:hypothetical protein